MELTTALKKRYGFFDYNDLTTQTTPITITGGAGYIDLTNDGAGANSNFANKPTSLSDIYNTVTNEFDFSDLGIGDTLEIRLDLVVTTSSISTEVAVRIDASIGSPSNFQIPFVVETEYKQTGTHQLNRYNAIYIGSNDTKNFPSKFQMKADKTCTVTVNGWYVYINRIAV